MTINLVKFWLRFTSSHVFIDCASVPLRIIVIYKQWKIHHISMNNFIIIWWLQKTLKHLTYKYSQHTTQTCSAKPAFTPLAKLTSEERIPCWVSRIDMSQRRYWHLTHCGSVTPYNWVNIGSGKWLDAWRHQAITWTNSDKKKSYERIYHVRKVVNNHLRQN